MSDLCHDLVGTEPRKRKAEELPEEQRALIERTGYAGVLGGGGDGWLACGVVPPVAWPLVLQTGAHAVWHAGAILAAQRLVSCRKAVLGPSPGCPFPTGAQGCGRR